MKLQWTNLTNAHLIIADQKIKYKKQTMKERYNLELLKLRNAIADKERWVANANRELAMDGWLLDWNELIHRSDDEISEIIKRIENE